MATQTPAPAAIAELFAQRKVDAVCFDVDSTICPNEGIDDLAAFLGVGPAVAAVTTLAMNGSLSFREALAQRLAAMNITRASLAAFLKAHPGELSPGAKDLVDALRSAGIAVFLVSGGFRALIDPVAEALGLDPARHVVANTFVFASEDAEAVATFDESEPTSASGGKARAVQTIKDAHGYAHVVMVGDGATDVEARPPATYMIGYGGIVVREKVLASADWFVYSHAALQAIVPPAAE